MLLYEKESGKTLNIANSKKLIASPLKEAMENNKSIKLVYESEVKTISKYKDGDHFVKIDNSNIVNIIKTNTFEIKKLLPYGEHATVKAFRAGKKAEEERFLKEGITLPEKKEKVNPYHWAPGYENILLCCDTSEELEKQCKLSIAVNYGSGDSSTSVYEVEYVDGTKEVVDKETLIEKHIIANNNYPNKEFEATNVLALTLDCTKIVLISSEE